MLWLSGMLKLFLDSYFLEFNWTGMMMGIVALDIIYCLLWRNRSFKSISQSPFLNLLLFYCFIIFSLVYSPSLSYKFEKVLYFLPNILYFVYPFFIRNFNIRKFIWVYGFVLIPISIYFIYNLTIGAGQADLIFKEEIKYHYLQIAIHLGILILLLDYYGHVRWLKILCIILLLATSARGPFLFLILTLFLYKISSYHFLRLSARKWSSYIISLVIGILFLIYYENLVLEALSRSQERFISVLGGYDNSLELRWQMYKYSFFQPFYNFSETIIGHGIGSFGIIYHDIDIKAYPHNIFLEIFFELGVIGLAIFSIALLRTFQYGRMSENVFKVIFLFLFFNALKSSSLVDLWVFFGSMGMIYSGELKSQLPTIGIIKGYE